MSREVLVFSLVEAICFVVAVLIAFLAWGYRDRTAGFPVFVTVAGTSGYTLAGLVRKLASEPVVWHVLNNVRYPLGVIIAIGTFYTAVEFTQRNRYKRPTILGLFAGYVVVNAAITLTDPLHGLVIADQTRTAGVYVGIAGPLFWVHAAVGLGIVVCAVILLLVNLPGLRGIYWKQALLLAAALSVLIVFFLWQSVAPPHPAFDLATVGIVIYCGLVLWGLFRIELLETVPVSRETLMQSMEDPVVAVDADDIVIDLNPPAVDLFGADGQAVGEPIDALLVDYPKLREYLSTAGERSTELTLERDGETKHYDLRVSPITLEEAPHDPGVLGRVVVLRDVTEAVERERELAATADRLERKNEQLERLSEVISHDLKTPLSTAEMNLARLEHELDGTEAGVDRTVADLKATHERLRQFADHLPQLARESTDVDDPIKCQLREVVQGAWDVVDTGDLELVIEDDATLEGDPTRLEQLFENLFANVAEHAVENAAGGAASTVHVGVAADGVFVEDDGPGIDEAQGAEIFEYGMGTGDGAGVGLAIVRSIVEAHGWSISVTESDSGGACFEIEIPEHRSEG